MTTVLLLHHVQGLTSGVRALADRLRAAGHDVHAPDCFDGLTFPDIPAGLAHLETLGFDEVVARAVRAAGEIDGPYAVIGMSMGVIAAQQLAQTRPEVTAAALLAGCVPPQEFGTPWPDRVPVQVHGAERDPIFATEGDLDAARGLVAAVPSGELYLYDTDAHLFFDDSAEGYDAAFTETLLDRVDGLLATR